MALLESSFENRFSFVEESRFFFFIIMFGKKMELYRELSHGQRNGSPRRAILVLIFSQCGNC